MILFHSLMLIGLSVGVLGETNICNVCSCSGIIIDCRSRKLNKTLDDSDWKGAENYTEALFDNNHIGHLTRLPSLPLIRLSYKNNRLAKIDDRAFFNLTKLEKLILGDNELTSDNLLPAVFEGPYDPMVYEPLKVKLLDLSSNLLHTLHSDLFEHLPYLEKLYLRQNPFKILDRSTVIAISSLPNLQILDLSFTRLKELPAGLLHTPKRLYELILRGNFFTEVPSDVLAESHDLRILNLNENPIRVFSSERPFPEMPSLRYLHISFMPNLTRIENGSMSGLTGLEYLDCKMNEKLSYFSPAALKSRDILKLDLSDNALSYIDHEIVKPVWSSIKYINIMGNPLICDCENQWIVSELIPLLKNLSCPFEGLECAEPSAMKGHRLITLYRENYSMRCLDLYGNHPENDGPILISIFVIVVLTMIIVILVLLWLRSSNSCRKGGRVNYQRAFYRPTKQDDPDRY